MRLSHFARSECLILLAPQHSDFWLFGLPLPKRGRAGKMQRVRSLVEERLDDGNQKFLAEGLLDDYKHFLDRKDADMARIRKAALSNRDVLRLMQLPGIGIYIAFAIVSFVEDISRFGSAKKLVSYFGLNPAVNSSGEQERRQRMHGREHGHLSRFGRSDMKHLCAEIGQTLLRRNDCPAAKWAKRKLAEGKNCNRPSGRPAAQQSTRLRNAKTGT